MNEQLKPQPPQFFGSLSELMQPPVEGQHFSPGPLQLVIWGPQVQCPLTHVVPLVHDGLHALMAITQTPAWQVFPRSQAFEQLPQWALSLVRS